MKDITQKIQESNNESITISLTADELDKILYSLGLAAGVGGEVTGYEYKLYKKLWYDLRKAAEKGFDKMDPELPKNWFDYEYSVRGSIRHLD